MTQDHLWQIIQNGRHPMAKMLREMVADYEAETRELNRVNSGRIFGHLEFDKVQGPMIPAELKGETLSLFRAAQRSLGRKTRPSLFDCARIACRKG